MALLGSSNWMDDVAPTFRSADAGLKPGATPQTVSSYFVDTTPDSAQRFWSSQVVVPEMSGLWKPRLAVILAVSLVAAGWGCGAARGQSANEYQVKAAFLYNFAKFVEWPPQSFKGPDDPLAICVMGHNPFGRMLEDTVNGKTLEGRPFVVRNVPDNQQARGCHILFVSSSERKHLQFILESIKSPGVLTVGEMEGFATNGGVINFKLEDGKVRFEVNLEAAATEGLQIRSSLLSLAEIVKK